jgi:sulfite reductase (ferredoxin)
VAIVPPHELSEPITSWINRAHVLLVIASPSALVISKPVSILSAHAAAARRGVLIKGGMFLEKLAKVKAVALDKTGTLTRGALSVAEVTTVDGVEPDEVVAAAEGICKLFRDHGNRADRKRARLKYVMHDWGVEKFRDVFYRDYFTGPRRAPREAPITGLDLHHGWHSMGGGKWFLGLSVENGRIKDDGALRLRTGLRAIVAKYKCDVRLTTQQDILLCGLTADGRPGVDSMLSEYGIPRPETLSQVQRWSMACPAIPTCPLAITESERALPGLVDQLEVVLNDLGLANERISVRMTGCPNGCARPYQSEVGIVGRGGTKFTLYIGGDTYGRRLNTELQDSVPVDQIVPKLAKVFAAFKSERAKDELFGDYCERVGLAKLKELLGPPA